MRYPDGAALQSSVVAAMLGVPLVTPADRQGLVHRLSADFVNSMQITEVIYPGAFPRGHHDVAVRRMGAYLRRAREEERLGVRTGRIARIMEEYTGAPADVVRQAARPYYGQNSRIDLDDLGRLQGFFKKRGLPTYQRALDSRIVVDPSVAHDALAIVEPARR